MSRVRREYFTVFIRSFGGPICYTFITVDVARLEKIASRNPAGNARDSQRRASLPLAWALVK